MWLEYANMFLHQESFLLYHLYLVVYLSTNE